MRQTLSALIKLGILLFCLGLLFNSAQADIPKQISFQGVLKDPLGNPVPNGVYTIRFRIYDDSTAGSALWEETVPVLTSAGLFTVRLGDATPLPNNVFSTGVNRFVGIRVNLDPEITPRTRLASVQYAFQALRSDSATTATVALDLTCAACVSAAEIDVAQVQRRVTGTAPLGQYITAINQDGSVVTAADQVGTGSGWIDDGTVVRLSDGTDNVGIGTTSPVAKLHVNRGAGEGLPGNLVNEGLLVNNNSTATDNAAINIIGGSSGYSRINFGDNGSATTGFIRYNHSTNALEFGTTGFQVMTLDGSLLGVGEVNPSTRLYVSEYQADVATFNRNGNDGEIVRIATGGTTQGTISVSGATVSYNAFTGSHYGWTKEELERGELVSLTGTNRNSHDETKGEVIYGIKKSTAPNDPACLGSYLGLQSPGQPYSSDNPHLVMAVGNGEMWVVDEGKNIQPGDYLISSSTPGHAMKDDEEKYPVGHIVARAAESVYWSTVSESVNGHKHKRISVLFGNFVRSNTMILDQTIEEQQRQIEDLERRMLKLETGLLRTQTGN